MDNHKFWKTQPIDISKNNTNDSVQDAEMDNVQKDPFKLPTDFSWFNFDITNETELNNLYNFLLDYYVDDIDASKRFHYSKDTLKWFLMPKDYYQDLILGIKYKNKIVASICGIPMYVKVLDKVIKMVQINFLCIHNSLRNKRLAPVLIQEITRRTNLHDIWQAYFTADVDLPNKIVKTTYHLRPLNVPKLLDLNYMHIIMNNPEKIQLSSLKKMFNVNEKLSLSMRPLEEKDCFQCCHLMNKFHQKFKISIYFTEEQFKSHFMVKSNVLNCFVIETDGLITDFISFFHLPSQVRNNPKYNDIKVVFGYYYFNYKNSMETIISNCLTFFKEMGIDLVNVVDSYDNNSFIEKLKFKKGSADLNFFFYNWNTLEVKNDEFALIMV